MKTTLNEIRKYNPCKDRWEKLLKHLGKTKSDDAPLDFMTILEDIGIKDTCWCLRTKDYKDYCLFLADLAESVLHIYENKYADDKRPRQAIQAIRNWKQELISDEQLKNYADAAYAAYANHVVYAANLAASANVANVAYVAAYVADSANAYSAANATIYAANANDSTAYAAAWNEIEQLFIKHFEVKTL